MKDLTSEKPGQPQLSRTGLGNAWPKNKRFSSDGQNIAQNYTTMGVVVKMQFWTTVSPLRKIYNQLRLPSNTEKGKYVGVDNILAELVQSGG